MAKIERDKELAPDSYRDGSWQPALLTTGAAGLTKSAIDDEIILLTFTLGRFYKQFKSKMIIGS